LFLGIAHEGNIFLLNIQQGMLKGFEIGDWRLKIPELSMPK